MKIQLISGICLAIAGASIFHGITSDSLFISIVAFIAGYINIMPTIIEVMHND